MPTHAPGNLIVMWAFRATNNTPPTKPTASGTVPNFSIILNPTGTSGCSSVLAYFVATASNHTSGTWTGTNSLIAAVLTGVGSTPIGANGQLANTATTPTAPSITLTNTDGSSAILQYFGANGSFAPTSWSAAPTGYTQRQTQAWIVMDTKNSTTSDGSVSQANSGDGGANGIGVSLEIRAY